MAPPFLLELICLALLVIILIALGMLIRRRWSANNEPVPVPVAVGSWLFVVAIYFFFGAILLFSNPRTNPFGGISESVAPQDGTREGTEVTHIYTDEDGTTRIVRDYRPDAANDMRFEELDRRIRPLAIYAILGLLCIAYYTLLMVNALSQRFVERIDPFSARIEDPSEFSEARKLALRGDIDGAVRVYRCYTEKPAEAHFEAARLLKSHDRFHEAAQLLQEMADRFYGNRIVWADATYQLAKLYDNHLGRPDEGAALLRHILERAPETRFGQLASNEMSRLRALGGIDADAESKPRPPRQAAPPKAAPGTRRQYDEPVQVRPRRAIHDDESYIPPVDPFYVQRYGMSNEELLDSDSEDKDGDTGDEKQDG